MRISLQKLFSHHKFIHWLVGVFFILLFVWLLYSKIQVLWSHYGMSDVDTDGWIWMMRYQFFVKSTWLLYSNTTILAYPFGYDISYIPFFSLIYAVRQILYELFGANHNTAVTIMLWSSMITYPLSGIVAYLLCYKITKHHGASIIWGMMFACGYYFTLYGRGSLSQNHIYFIPLFYYFLISYVEHHHLRDWLISIIIFALLFMVNPYWAFFTGIFIIPIFIWYRQNLKITTILLSLTKYLVPLITVTILINLNFIQQQLYVFNQSTLKQWGKTDSVANYKTQLINASDYILPPNQSLIFWPEWDRSNFSLWFIWIILFLLWFIVIKNKKLFYIYTSCLIVAFALTANLPLFEPIQRFYFTYFNMFRSVSRLLVFLSLFLAILSSITLSQLLPKNTYSYLIIFILSLGIVAEGKTSDLTLYQTTNIDNIYETFSPIKNNSNIKVIAGYPMNLSNWDNGFPPNYEMIAQSIHHKKLVGWVNPFNQKSIDFHAIVKDIVIGTGVNNEAINLLTAHRVDTIMIYDVLLPWVSDILKLDPRVRYLWTYQWPYDNSLYVSFNQLARQYSLFQIKKVVIDPLLRSEFFDSNRVLEYQHVGWNKKLLTVRFDKNDMININFLQPHSEWWNFYPYKWKMFSECDRIQYYRSYSYTWNTLAKIAYVVKTWDTLRNISATIGLSQNHLLILNNLSNSSLYVGQKLLLQNQSYLTLIDSNNVIKECVTTKHTVNLIEDIGYLVQNPIWDLSTRKSFDGTMNRTIDLNRSVNSNPSISLFNQWLQEWRITSNPDGGYIISLVLYYQPKSLSYILNIISILMLISLVSLTIYVSFKRKHLGSRWL